MFFWDTNWYFLSCLKKGRKILDKLDMWTPWWLSKNFFDYFSFLLLSSFKTRNLWLILLLRIKHDQLSNCMFKDQECTQYYLIDEIPHKLEVKRAETLLSFLLAEIPSRKFMFFYALRNEFLRSGNEFHLFLFSKNDEI